MIFRFLLCPYSKYKVEDKNPEGDDGLTPQELMWNNVELIRIDQN